MQTGVLENIRSGLDGRQQAAVEYGVGALVGGITRFVFGREVVNAAQSAFPDAPGTFPAYLDVPAKPEKADNDPNRALEALKDAAKAVGAGVSTRAVAVRSGVASAADVVTRPFRSVDLDGDGVPDEPQALTAVKGVGGPIAGAAGAISDGVSGLFKPKKRGKHAAGNPSVNSKREPTRTSPRSSRLAVPCRPGPVAAARADEDPAQAPGGRAWNALSSAA